MIVSADDFGMSEGVNEAIEMAHRVGILSTASLMVTGSAAADAVRRAKRLPGLRVGLHLVVVEGDAMLPAALPHVVDARGRFPASQARLGVDYFFRPVVRKQLAREVEAQYRAFMATGLRLDHANAHKHMHLHPTVGALLIRAGLEHGLTAMRVPSEPPRVMQACGTEQGVGARALYGWTRLLRWQGRRAGLQMNDWAFGLAWTGHMTAERLQRLAPALPLGLSEVYLHPGLGTGTPGYDHKAELAALLDPAVREAFEAAGVAWTGYGAAPFRE